MNPMDGIIESFRVRGATASVEDLPRLALELKLAIWSPCDLGEPRQSWLRREVTRYRVLPVPEGWPILPKGYPPCKGCGAFWDGYVWACGSRTVEGCRAGKSWDQP